MNDLEAFYRDNVRLVYAMALGQTGNAADAEDLTQETFLRAWRHFRVLATLAKASQRAWLVRTMRHLAIDAWRRQSSCPVVPLDEAFAVPEPGERRELRADVTRALSQLSPEDRVIVILRYFLEMTSREIGEMLQMPESTVRHRLMQCRSRLAERLAAWKPGGDRE